MTYLSDIANEIRAEVPEHLLPDENADLLFLQYALLLLAKGDEVRPEDVHNAWSVWMTYLREPHESLVPYNDLPLGTRVEDEPFVQAIRRVAARRRVGE